MKSSTRKAQSSGASYNQILRSSSIIGGAQAVNYAIALLRTKFVAVLIGPSGVGLVGLFTSTMGVLETLMGLGIRSSGVREIADAHSTNNPQRLAHAVKTLKRACWITGIAGWLITAALAYPISSLVFDSPQHALALVFLGSTVLIGSVSGGQMAFLQGIRRIGDLARINVLGIACGTIIAVPLYWRFGEDGIVPALILSAVANLALSSWFAGKVKVEAVEQTARQTLQGTKSLLGLGVVFMWSALLTALVTLAIKALIQRELGLEANGFYQAAWAVSGMFAGFILGAMSADFYPRLTAAKDDHGMMGRLVNEQTEVGVLLALPGLVATLVFAPLVITLLYSREFAQAAALLPWFILGVFGRVISWPMGFVMPALGAGKWYAFSETANVALHLALAVVLLGMLGLQGVAIAFALLYLIYTASVAAISFHLIRFRWSASALRVLLIASVFVALAFGIAETTTSPIKELLGVTILMSAALYALRGLAQRVGETHRVVRAIYALPWARQFFAK